MRPILYGLLLLGLVAFGVARYADQAAKATGPKALAVTAKAQAPPAAAGRTATLKSDGRGHFQVEARVDGRYIDFLIDTGASLIALRESSAAKLGIHPSARDYSVKMQTANGVGKAARVELNSVEVNGITVSDVEAFVIPDEQLSTNLLACRSCRG